MLKIINTIKIVGYFCSLVLPLFDAFKGVKNGVKQAIKDVKEENENADIYRFYHDNEVVVDFEEEEEDEKEVK